jgi:hypothetical protein
MNAKLIKYKGKAVYYVDSIPCTFRKVHDNWAEVDVINTEDYTSHRAFIAIFNGYTAHGETIRDAFIDAKEKWMQSMDFTEKKKRFLALFKDRERLTVKELYDWHGVLTGSCRYGRSTFQAEHGLKDTDTLTLEEFINLTENSYGGDKIKRLKSKKAVKEA